MGEGFWTDDRVEQLKALRAESLSFGLIARMMGISRSAVIGKVWRLKLEPRTPAHTVRPRRVRSTIERKKPTKPATSPVAATPGTQTSPHGSKHCGPKAEGIRLLRSRAWTLLPGTTPVGLLERTGCCWPVDGPDGETLFCNAPCDGHPNYCATHHAIMVLPRERRAA